MRRFISTALLALFVLQSSGAVMAAPSSSASAPSLLGQIHFAFTQMVDSLAGTEIGAFVLGRESLYQAMHAPPPDFTEARKDHGHQPPTIVRFHSKPVFRPGVLVLTPADRDPRMPQPVRSSGVPSPAVRRHTSYGLVPSLTDRLSTATVSAGNGGDTTGINRWWTYEQGGIPGAGAWMSNVATGNLLVQETDVDIPERGIDLAFRRTYNSQSKHDYANTDGSVPSHFGDGWTNTFDAHVVSNTGLNASCPTAQGITVYDIDGARYDYKPDCNGGFIPPPGMQGTSMALYVNGCIDGWMKKSGTFYAFYSDEYSSAACGGSAYTAYDGRLHKIYGRNWNNVIVLHYYWDNGDSTTDAQLNEIDAVHSDGQQLTLKFGDFSNGTTSYRELASLTRPDGQVIKYFYDSTGRNLSEVDEAPNGSNNNAAIPVQYTYGSGHQLQYVSSPQRTETGGTQGAYVRFDTDSNNALTGVQLYGVANFTPSDGTRQALQSGPQGNQQFSYITFNHPSGTETDLTDTDGHATSWYYDTVGRVTQTKEWTGAPNNVWLNRYTNWDPNDNLTASIDPRGNETDYAYDANGNIIAVALPQVTTSQGTFRPTSLYSYDNSNNVLAYCDPFKVGASGYDWVNRPQSDSLCATGTGATGAVQYQWDTSDSAEPYGRLTDTYTPLGYHVHITYDAASEASTDAGLPTMVEGASYSQADGTIRQPTQYFNYDSHGNLISLNKGNGTWTVSYDSLNQILVATDPDNVSSYACYYANGQLEYTENAYEHQADGSPASCQGTAPSAAAAYTYDADGDTVSTVNVDRSKTQNWYDGFDRLVETQYPLDGSHTESMRYLYDLTQGSTVALTNGPQMYAHGALFAVQHNGMDLRGWSYDALGRATEQYLYPPGAQVPTATTLAYDADPATYGLLARRTDALNNVKTTTYDADGQETAVSFNDNGITPNRTYTYDPDGRVMSLSNSVATDSYQYDADGRVTASTQGVTGASGAETVAYTYYPDGMRQALSLSGAAGTQANLYTYAYRTDGKLQYQGFTYGSYSTKFTWGYSAAGRTTNFTDPYFSRNMSYNSYGWLSSDQIPNGSYSDFVYDSFGQVVAFKAYSGINGLGQTMGPASIGITYSSANQLVGIDYEGLHTGMKESMVACGVYNNLGYAEPAPGDCDARTNALVSGGTEAFNNGDHVTYSYDAAGRQTTSYHSWSYNDTCKKWTSAGWYTEPCTISGSFSYTRIFDAENHLLGGQPQSVKGPYGVPWSAPPDPYITSTIPPPPYDGGSTTATQQLWYGPDGHLVRSGVVPSSSSPPGTLYGLIYYDGDQPLFSNTLADGVPIGDFASYGPINGTQTWGLTVYDRDFTGNVAARHDASGYSGWSPTVASGQGIQCSTCAPLRADEFVPDYFPRGSSGWDQGTSTAMATYVDGVSDGLGNHLQGARTYDPNLGNWTAPDAYQGDVTDPMSLMPYMWDNDNPIAYSDPSGYCTRADGTSDGTNQLCVIVSEKAVPSPEKAASDLRQYGPHNPQMVMGAAVGPEGAEEDAGEMIIDGAQMAARGARMAEAVRLGQAGEAAVRAVYDIGPKLYGQVPGRVPDGINVSLRTISEVKNVARQGWTKQLKEYSAWAKAHGYTFNLYLRRGAERSAELDQAQLNNEVRILDIP